ncbi:MULTISPECIES: NACHT domain-containing protein [unclassified Coleofasciculus]|uniref:NACHT domain-containing protein n=1 Tax=unclassified Coleofasciculus TaxID=2692782 RepID=UPI00187FC415|nr:MULTISPECIES: NACHT domain-containing NTPase [unclassified Coleofasciculus]MBE9127056.1 NACHT domain-containing NTPase [Coleofasciculus sp. LEGE 07081]MBE9150444.1 NACHT domain-containing NTPase [Coleofasciculus sp. LEGE 07092]
MVSRSLHANAKGIIRAKESMARKHWTQEFLAGEVGLKTRQSIGRFFAGRAVDRRVFIEICFQLDLDWQQIAQNTEPELLQTMSDYKQTTVNIDILVERVRSQCQEKIDSQCSTLQMLDLPQPIKLTDIYVDLYVLEDIPNRRWLEIPDLLQDLNFDQDTNTVYPLNADEIVQTRVLASEALAKYSKLMVLGKPGTGKSTFLKFVTLQCNHGRLQSDRLPIYIELKFFVEDATDLNNFSLEHYICQELALCGVSADEVKVLLTQGRLLFLLDGLDEVQESELHHVIKEIRRLSQRYYKNSFIITCRLAANLYRFQGFTEVEIANFTNYQIAAFVNKYFVAVSPKNQEEGLVKASQFIEQLEKPDNFKIRELAVTPLLLNLACLVFQSKASFPIKNGKLYQEGIDILLVKWDRSKGVRRDQAYQKLSLADKIKLLNQLGATTFEQEEYFFEQSQAEQYIADYLRQLSVLNGKTDPVALQLDSQAVLKSIEQQHGVLIERSRRIYSFSHISFQSYFTAQHLTTTADLETDNHQVLKKLVTHITGKRWRDIFLLATEMLRRADDLMRLMKQQIDRLLPPDEKLLQFLQWIDNKSESISGQYKPTAVRAFFFSLALTLDDYLTNALNPDWVNNSFPHRLYLPLSHCLSLALSLDPDFTLHQDCAFNFNARPPEDSLAPALSRGYILNHTVDCVLHFDLAVAPTSLRELQGLLGALQAQLPENGAEPLNLWWERNHQGWTEQFISLISEHQNLGHSWQFSQEQRRLLWQYYEANQLLVDCLHTSSELTPEVRSHIEETLLVL